MIAAAAFGHRLARWNTAVTYSSGKVSTVTMTYQPDTSIKMQWAYTYSGNKLATETWKYDKGLGAGYETLSGGTLTMSYSGDNLTGVTSS
jgi:hypothetical protein